jgi:hypothetical protein
MVDFTSFEALQKYSEVLRFISIPPTVFIIHFGEKVHVDKSTVDIICKVIKILNEAKVRVILSDIDNSNYNQMEFYDTDHIIGSKDLFTNI